MNTHEMDVVYHAAEDTLGGRLSLARELTGLSLEESARLANATPEDWGAWESDRSAPPSYQMPMVAGVLGVNLLWLACGEGPGPRP